MSEFDLSLINWPQRLSKLIGFNINSKPLCNSPQRSRYFPTPSAPLEKIKNYGMYNPFIQVTWDVWSNSKYSVKGCYSILMAHVSSPDLEVFELYKSCRILEGCSFILVLSLIIWYQRSLLLNILTTTLTITVSSFERLNAASKLTPSWELIIPIEILTPVSCVSILQQPFSTEQILTLLIDTGVSLNPYISKFLNWVSSRLSWGM